MNSTLIDRPLPDNVRPIKPAEQYHSKIITTLAEFDELSVEWNALLREAKLENGCLRHEWFSTWLKHFTQSQIRIILVRNAQGQLVAAAPFSIQKGINGFFRRRLRHVQIIGTELSVYDWTEIPVSPLTDEKGALNAIADALLSIEKQWDVLELHYWLETRQLEILRDRLSRKTHRSEILEASRMPYIRLPESAEAYLGQKRDKRLKKSVNAGRNRLKTNGMDLKLEFRSPSEETDAILDRFFEQHTAYWTGRGRVSNFVRFPQLSRFYKEVFKRSHAFQGTDEPHMQFSVLKTGETHMSYQFGFWQDNTYLDYINSYSEEAKQYSPGILHKEELILHILQQGGNLYNFGRGLEEYKELWTRESVPLWSLLLYRTPLAYQLCQTDVRLKKLLKRPK